MSTKAEILHAAAIGQGPLSKIGDEEEIFILRAQDKHMAPILRMWAERVQKEVPPQALPDHDGLSNDTREHNQQVNLRRLGSIQKIHDARALADRVEQWENQKNPD